MRAVRYSGAAIVAGVLAVAVVATVAAARTDRTLTSVATINVAAFSPAGVGPTGSGLTLRLSVGTVGSAALTFDRRWRDADGASRTIAFHGQPDVSRLDIDPDLRGASLAVSFTATDGARHELRAELRATGPVETWRDGPFTPDVGDAVAALSACDGRAVHGEAALLLDGSVLAPDATVPAADIVSRACSTVALHR